MLKASDSFIPLNIVQGGGEGCSSEGNEKKKSENLKKFSL